MKSSTATFLAACWLNDRMFPDTEAEVAGTACTKLMLQLYF
jgi:hypothetical protein